MNCGTWQKGEQVTELTDRQFLKELSELYTEHRSDVSDIINIYLSGSLVDGKQQMEEMRESRFIEAEFEGLSVEYDTLTTLFHFMKPNEDIWIPVTNCKYKDCQR